MEPTPNQDLQSTGSSLFENLPHASEDFRSVPNSAEIFRTVPQPAEDFRTIPQSSAEFRTVPKGAERKEDHALTVREAARIFETAGVARTERSIVNWCQLNAQGIARLDAYFDPNERKYFITRQSVESAVAEEKAKAAKLNSNSEPFGSTPKPAAKAEAPISTDETTGGENTKVLRQQIMDLQITNKAKDYFIEQLQGERKANVEKLMEVSHKIGQLESKLLQLGSAKDQSLNATEQLRSA